MNEPMDMDKYNSQLCRVQHGLCGHNLEKQPSKWVSFHDGDTILLIKTEIDHTNTAHIVETLTIDRKTGELK